MNRILHIVMFACAIVVAFCSCEADEQLPTTNGGEHIYTMSLDAALNDYDAATTRVGYNWSDGTILYLQFVVGNQTIVGNATYSKEADAWSVTTTEALANVDSARCEAYYFKELVQSETSVIPLSNTTAVYQDTCGYYVKTDNYLSVSLRLSPKTGRIRFKGEPGRKFTIRGMYQLSGYDILDNRFDSTKVELLPTVTDDGFTPYYYVFFSDTSRTLNVVDDSLWYERSCPSVVLASGRSGYMDVPTEAIHSGWSMLDKASVVADAVDLGLSVKWASWNVGATAPEEYGGYYAWGEIEEKDNYDWTTYKWCNGSSESLTKYTTTGDGYLADKAILEIEDDAAHVSWGGSWRMPTMSEIRELVKHSTLEWTSVNGTNGYRVTSSNGNSIFLPATGYRLGKNVYANNSRCSYWSATLNQNYLKLTLACCFSTGWAEQPLEDWDDRERYYGLSIRPVKDLDIVAEEPIVETIEGVLTLGEGNTVKTQGSIVAIHTHGILLHDETGYIHVRLDANTDNVVGDIATVKGNLTPWGGLLEFGTGATIEKIGTAEVVHPEPVVWDAVALDSYLSTPKIQYVQYTGVLSQNESIYNVAVDGASTAIGSIDCPSTDMVNADWIGKKVTVTGYAYGCNDEQSINTMAISVKVVEEPVEEPTIDETAVAEAVDLGLSVMWASWNVGATAPEEYGGYYAWGETEVKDNYDWSTYKWCNGTEDTMTKYCIDRQYGTVDNRTILDPEDDVANVKWGDNWRLPTEDEIIELQRCSSQMTMVNGVNGFKYSGPNGNSIFLPYEASINGYWTSTTDGRNSAVGFLLASGGISEYRYEGLPVRPVKDKEPVEEEPIVETIEGVLASGEGKPVKTQGTIVTTHTHGILVHDETGYIHIRLDANTDNVVGDVVTVKGNLTPWGGLLEFAAGAIVEKVGTAEVVHPKPIVWDGVALDSYLSTPKIQYVQYTGVLNQNESIYNVAVDDASTAIGSIDCPSTDMVNADWIGKKVTVTGYAYGCNDEQSVSTMAISVEVVEDPVEGEPTIDETAVAEAVDLGLSVKWASWNVGATAPEESGGYYAWGETKPKDYYPADYDPPTSWNNISSTQYDVAHVKWGNGWRMPTGGEMHELCNNCSWQRDSINGINGILITGVTGNSIFLPASGYYYDKELRKEGARGYYWAGEETFNIGQNSDLPNCLRLDLEEDVFQCITTWHHFGFPIRPVKE